VCEFTLPLIWWSHYQNSQGLVSGGSANTIPVFTVGCVSPPIGPDAAGDTNIDFVIYSAATADCQFVDPLLIHSIYSYTSLKAVPQSDIHAEFKRSFRPFVEDSRIITEDHEMASETTALVTDVMKRYQAATYAATGINQNVVSLDYAPSSGTIGAVLNDAFLYSRGGVSYKITAYQAASPGDFFQPISVAVDRLPDGHLSSNPAGLALGESVLYNLPSATVFDFSVPWMFGLPYLATRNFSTGETANVSVGADGNYNSSSLSTLYTCVRDDYEVGFLIPPDPSNYTYTPPSQQKARKPKPIFYEMDPGIPPSSLKVDTFSIVPSYTIPVKKQAASSFFGSFAAPPKAPPAKALPTRP
jgi:hypothetical protein